MQLLSEQAQTYFKKIFTDTFGNYIRGIFISFVIFIAGGISGAFFIANSINPRLSTVEAQQNDLRGDFDTAYSSVDARLKLLEDAKLETSVQLQMIILYQIPQAERDALRKEAEKQVEQKLPEINE